MTVVALVESVQRKGENDEINTLAEVWTDLVSGHIVRAVVSLYKRFVAKVECTWVSVKTCVGVGERCPLGGGMCKKKSNYVNGEMPKGLLTIVLGTRLWQKVHTSVWFKAFVPTMNTLKRRYRWVNSTIKKMLVNVFWRPNSIYFSNRPILINMLYMMIRSMIAEILSFSSKDHDTVSACNCGQYTLFSRVLHRVWILKNHHLYQSNNVSNYKKYSLWYALMRYIAYTI